MWGLHNYQLIIAYQGAAYQGWQKTPMGPSIEEKLEQALFQILRHSVALQAASRTDAGVHAEGQVVNFILNTSLPDLSQFLHRLNGILPRDIRVLSLTEKPTSFHPTLDAKAKEYTYWICTDRVQLPPYRTLSWHFPYPLDLNVLKSTIPYLLGTHDFSSFCNERHLWTRSTLCTLNRIQYTPMPYQRLHIDIQGDHFLYKMVRNLIGTLAYIGSGKMPLERLLLLLQTKDRTLAGPTAPAHGLRLRQVFYTE